MNSLRRPWWKRKRWIAVPVWLMALAYPAIGGLFAYAVGRGWIAQRTLDP